VCTSVLGKDHGSGVVPAASTANAVIEDANIQGGTISLEKMRRITEKVKNIRF